MGPEQIPPNAGDKEESLEDILKRIKKKGDERFQKNREHRDEAEKNRLISGAKSIPELFAAIEEMGDISGISVETIKSRLLELAFLQLTDSKFNEILEQIPEDYGLRIKATQIMPAVSVEGKIGRTFGDWAYLEVEPDPSTKEEERPREKFLPQGFGSISDGTWQRIMPQSEFGKEIIDKNIPARTIKAEEFETYKREVVMSRARMTREGREEERKKRK